jgi:hypothetical protein
MNNAMMIGAALVGTGIPFLCRGAFQHGSRRRSCDTHSVIKEPNAVGSVRILIAQTLVTDGLYDFDAVPIGFQFIRDDPWETGSNARPHFTTVGKNRDDAVWSNGDE